MVFNNMKFAIYTLVVMIALVFFGMISISFAKDIEYSATNRLDGGYSLNIVCIKRLWKPITAEGFFPLERTSYAIDIIGKGKDWTYRGQNGYHYSLVEIQSNQKAWDFGYAWIDAERKYLYLNLYWVSSPDNMIPSDINGRYRLTENSK